MRIINQEVKGHPHANGWKVYWCNSKTCFYNDKNMLTFEQCVKLKELGFPQDFELTSFFYDKKYNPPWLHRYSLEMEEDENRYVKCPFACELLDQVEYPIQITKSDKKEYTVTTKKGGSDFITTEKTAEEAMYKAYLFLYE